MEKERFCRMPLLHQIFLWTCCITQVCKRMAFETAFGMSTRFHYSSSCLTVKSQVLDFGSKVNSSTTCSSYLANSRGLRAKGNQERGQTHMHKHEEVPRAGVTWSRTKCAKLAHTHVQKKNHTSAFPSSDFALQVMF